MTEWLNKSKRSFYIYSIISSASVRSIPFLSFIRPIFAWNVPLMSLTFVRRSLVFHVLFVSFCGDIYFGGFQVFWLTISTGKASLGGPFWSLMTVLVLWVYDLPNGSLLLDITAHVSPRRLHIQVVGGWSKLLGLSSVEPVGTSLSTSLSSPVLLSTVSPYMALNWLQVHSLRGITWHA